MGHGKSYFSSSSCECAKVHEFPRGHMPLCVWSRHMLVLQRAFCRGSSSFFFWLKLVKKSMSACTTVRRAFNTASRFSHDGGGASVHHTQKHTLVTGRNILPGWGTTGTESRNMLGLGFTGTGRVITWVGINISQELQVRSETLQVTRVTGSLEGNGQFTDTL